MSQLGELREVTGVSPRAAVGRLVEVPGPWVPVGAHGPGPSASPARSPLRPIL